MGTTANHPPTDIRAILKARWDEARQERQRLIALIRELEAAEHGYARALEAENRRFQRAHEDLNQDDPEVAEVILDSQIDELVNGSTAKNFLLQTMANGAEWTLDDLKEQAERAKLAVAEGVSIGRVLHGALLGLRHNDQVEQIGRGVWRKK